jgi:hypothetical protein
MHRNSPADTDRRWSLVRVHCQSTDPHRSAGRSCAPCSAPSRCRGDPAGVVKKGCRARDSTALLIPQAVSATVVSRYSPSCHRPGVPGWDVSPRVLIVISPACGMASRAFNARFNNAVSNWAGSACAMGRSSAHCKVHTHIPAQSTPQHLLDSVQGGLQIERLQGQTLVACQRHQLPRQRRATAHRMQHASDQPACSGSLWIFDLQQLQVAGHEGQQVGEIVRDTSGQLTQGIKTLRMGQRVQPVLPLFEDGEQGGKGLQNVTRVVIESTRLAGLARAARPWGSPGRAGAAARHCDIAFVSGPQRELPVLRNERVVSCAGTGLRLADAAGEVAGRCQPTHFAFSGNGLPSRRRPDRARPATPSGPCAFRHPRLDGSTMQSIALIAEQPQRLLVSADDTARAIRQQERIG